MDDDTIFTPRTGHAESGASLVEYALLVLLILLIAAPAVASFGTALEEKFRGIAGGGSFTTMGDGGFEIGEENDGRRRPGR
jgi:Flp pilus assembly pilin Flp